MNIKNTEYGINTIYSDLFILDLCFFFCSKGLLNFSCCCCCCCCSIRNCLAVCWQYLINPIMSSIIVCIGQFYFTVKPIGLDSMFSVFWQLIFIYWINECFFQTDIFTWLCILDSEIIDLYKAISYTLSLLLDLTRFNAECKLLFNLFIYILTLG